LVSAIEVVDAIFGAGKTRFKTVLGGRLRLHEILQQGLARMNLLEQLGHVRRS
jgi:hypothetical protein